MAYGQTQNGGGNSSYKPAQKSGTAVNTGSKPAFEKDPNEVGIAYLKNSEKVGNYFSVSISKDIPAGAKLVIFENKTKNRTEKTPTHVLKLSTAARK